MYIIVRYLNQILLKPCHISLLLESAKSHSMKENILQKCLVFKFCYPCTCIQCECAYSGKYSMGGGYWLDCTIPFLQFVKHIFFFTLKGKLFSHALYKMCTSSFSSSSSSYSFSSSLFFSVSVCK